MFKVMPMKYQHQTVFKKIKSHTHIKYKNHHPNHFKQKKRLTLKYFLFRKVITVLK